MLTSDTCTDVNKLITGCEKPQLSNSVFVHILDLHRIKLDVYLSPKFVGEREFGTKFWPIQDNQHKIEVTYF
jgi:hypothetical protein